MNPFLRGCVGRCVGLLIGAALFSPACAAPVDLPLPAQPALSVDVPGAPRPIGPPIVRLGPDTSRTVYWLLGTFDEYLGRAILVEDPQVVERFYCNESEVAAGFRRVLARFTREQGLVDDTAEEVVQGCLVYYRSSTIATALNSVYEDHRRGAGIARTSDGFRREITVLRISSQVFEHVGRGGIMAYLSGAYYRYGRDNAFVFANAHHKADVIALLLERVGVEGIRRQTFEGIPNTSVVHFRASPDLMKKLREPM